MLPLISTWGHQASTQKSALSTKSISLIGKGGTYVWKLRLHRTYGWLHLKITSTKPIYSLALLLVITPPLSGQLQGGTQLTCGHHFVLQCKNDSQGVAPTIGMIVPKAIKPYCEISPGSGPNATSPDYTASVRYE